MEPHTTAATGLSVIIGASASSAVLATLGLTGQVVAWAMIGCVIGISWAPRASRARALLLFVCSTLVAAKAGATAAEVWYATSSSAPGALAAGLGIFFHPLLSTVVARLPAIIDKKV